MYAFFAKKQKKKDKKGCENQIPFANYFVIKRVILSYKSLLDNSITYLVEQSFVGRQRRVNISHTWMEYRLIRKNPKGVSLKFTQKERERVKVE